MDPSHTGGRARGTARWVLFVPAVYAIHACPAGQHKAAINAQQYKIQKLFASFQTHTQTDYILHTHQHTHTHTRTYTHEPTHTRNHRKLHSNKRTNTHAHTHTHTCELVCGCICARVWAFNTSLLVCARMQVPPHFQKRTHFEQQAPCARTPYRGSNPDRIRQQFKK